MKKLGLWAVRPKRNTSKRHPEHKVYPYLLRGKTIDQPNQVWAADVTYIPMQQGFLYLVAIIDWATRRVLSWRLSNTLTARFCVQDRAASGSRTAAATEGVRATASDDARKRRRRACPPHRMVQGLPTSGRARCCRTVRTLRR
jgi:transposase InsO family protein